MKVKPGCVYVIPPNRDLSILHDTLYLLELATPRGLRLPIDFFFRALADDRREHAVGVILSGMGSDGTLGLRAIREKGGLVLVQDPAGARFDILMDINLHGINGIEAMKLLRVYPDTAHIPIIALSANALAHDVARGMEAGFFRYLTKPIKLKEFMEALDAAVVIGETGS